MLLVLVLLLSETVLVLEGTCRNVVDLDDQLELTHAL
jgi:hypothetical protein